MDYDRSSSIYKEDKLYNNKYARARECEILPRAVMPFLSYFNKLFQLKYFP